MKTTGKVYCLLCTICFATLVAYGSNGGADKSKNAVSEEPAVAKNARKEVEQAPKLKEIRRIVQDPSWGDDTIIQDVAPVGGKNMYLVDFRLERIFVVDETGKLLHRFLKKGQGPGEFEYNFWIQVLGNNLWVRQFSKLDRFSMNGILQNEIRLKSHYHGLTMVDANRFAGVRDAVEGDKKNGKRVKRAGLWDLKENRLKLYRQSDKTGVFEFKQDGMYITLGFGGGITPNLITATDPVRGWVYICETDYYRIDVVDMDGNTVRTIQRRVEPVNYSAKAKKKTVENFSISGVDENTLRNRLMKQLSDQFCPVSNMFVTADGYLMVRRTVSPDHSGLDVFSPEGKYLATWTNPEGVKLTSATLFTHDRFAVIDDKGDLPVVVEYKIAPEGWE